MFPRTVWASLGARWIAPMGVESFREKDSGLGWTQPQEYLELEISGPVYAGLTLLLGWTR